MPTPTDACAIRQAGRMRRVLASCAVLSLLALAAGCDSMKFENPFLQRQDRSAERQSAATPPPAAAQATAADTQPGAQEQSQATEPQDDLAREVEQYVANLPMDDLHAKLARHEAAPEGTPPAGQARPADSAAVDPAVETGGASDAAAARTPAATASPHVPLAPEIVVSSPATPGAAEPAAPATPSARQSPAAPVDVRLETDTEPSASQDTRIVEIEISPAALATVAAEPSAAPDDLARANRSAGPNVGSAAGDLRDLLEDLRSQARRHPDSVGAALRLRLAQWSLGDESPAEDWPLRDAEKRRLAESIWQVVQAASTMDGPASQTDAQKFQQALESLDLTLRQVQPLRIPRAVLCWSVHNYGNYEALPKPWRFPAGRKNMVVLYCELAGFATEPHPDKPGWYRTLLGERLAILTADGRELWNYQDEQIEDVCRHPRRDFFVPKVLSIPGNLPAGGYVLKVTIRDRLANRVAEANLPFEIAAGASSATSSTSAGR